MWLWFYTMGELMNRISSSDPAYNMWTAEDGRQHGHDSWGCSELGSLPPSHSVVWRNNTQTGLMRHYKPSQSQDALNAMFSCKPRHLVKPIWYWTTVQHESKFPVVVWYTLASWPAFWNVQPLNKKATVVETSPFMYLIVGCVSQP